MTNLMQALQVLLLQSTVLLLLGLLALSVTRKRGPAVQSLVGRASLASVALLMLLLPLTGHIQPVVRVPESTPQQAATLPEREGEEVGAAGVSVQGAYNAKMDVKGTERKGAASSAPKFPAALPPTPLTSRPLYQGKRALALRVSSAALGGFLSVAAALLLWLGVCQWHLTRLRRTAQAITTGFAAALLAELTPNPPHLLSHPSVHSPFLAGYRRPAIFLPVAYETDFDGDALRAIFVHELAHRDRRDNLWTLVARLLTALLWPQPLLWLLVRQLEHISEDACDEAVLAHNCPPRAYADCLLSLATRPSGRRERALSAGVAPFRSSVGRRIRRILTTKGVHPMSPITLRLRLTAAALTLAAALSGAFLVSSAPAQVNSPAAAPMPKETADGHEQTTRQIERAKFKEDLAKHKIELAEAIMDDDLTQQQLTQAVHEALPQASPKKWQEAFDLEGRIGWSLSALKLWKTSKAASLIRNHPQSVAKFERFEGEALARLNHDTAKETELFPQTVQAARQLSLIHVLSEHLYEQNIKVFECRVETEALASMFRQRSSSSEGAAPAQIIDKPYPSHIRIIDEPHFAKPISQLTSSGQLRLQSLQAVRDQCAAQYSKEADAEPSRQTREEMRQKQELRARITQIDAQIAQLNRIAANHQVH